MQQIIVAMEGLIFSINVKENELVAAGACRREMTFWLRKSMTDVLMKDLKISLFTAHNRK